MILIKKLCKRIVMFKNTFLKQKYLGIIYIL